MEAHPSDSHTLARYVDTGGYAALLKALKSMAPEEITAEDLARHLGTIPYEILTLPGDTWDRVLV